MIFFQAGVKIIKVKNWPQMVKYWPRMMKYWASDGEVLAP
jgi:hypothetical protein